jgi:hypothetical protein
MQLDILGVVGSCIVKGWLHDHGKTKFLCAGQRVALHVATLGGTCDALSTISWATIPVTTGAWGRPWGQAGAR